MTLKTVVCIDGKINIFCNSNIMLNAGLDFSPTDKCRKFAKPTIKLQFEDVMVHVIAGRSYSLQQTSDMQNPFKLLLKQ
jgi:hypothetical protein